MPVATFFSVTVAPGTTAPDGVADRAEHGGGIELRESGGGRRQDRDDGREREAACERETTVTKHGFSLGEGLMLEARASISEQLQRCGDGNAANAQQSGTASRLTRPMGTERGVWRPDFDESRRAIGDRPAKPITADTMACGCA